MHDEDIFELLEWCEGLIQYSTCTTRHILYFYDRKRNDAQSSIFELLE